MSESQAPTPNEDTGEAGAAFSPSDGSPKTPQGDTAESPGSNSSTSISPSATVVATGELVPPSEFKQLSARIKKAPKPKLAAVPLQKLDYLRSYTFIFDQPDWPQTLLVGFICVLIAQFIPILPYMVFGGYLLLVADHQIEHPDVAYPSFSLQRFSDYLTASVWGLFLWVPTAILLAATYFAFYFAFIFGVISFSRHANPLTLQLALWILLPSVILFWTTLVIHVLMFFNTLVLATHLQGSISVAWNWRWQANFFRRTWMEQYAATLFLLISASVLITCGLLFFCIGSYASQAMLMMATAHLYAQLYRLHVSRGGTELPTARENREASEDNPT